MKPSVVSSLVVVLSAALGSAEAAEPVKLLMARANHHWDGAAVEGYVEVLNLAYAKKVTAVYRVEASAWTEAPATYVGATHDNLEAWRFDTEGVQLGYKQSATVEFALRYEVAGRTFWDNNAGRNYRIGFGYDPLTRSFLLGSGRVQVSWAGVYSSMTGEGAFTSKSVRGSALVKNLAREKHVRVVYSVDDWKTKAVAEADFSRIDSPGVDVWTFEVALPPATSQVEFAVQVEQDGETAWDNNFGVNYSLQF